MKKIIVTGFILVLTLPLFAGNERLEIRGAEAEELYNELMVEEKEAPKDDPDLVDRALFLKSLSGLLCTKEVIFRGRNKVHCTVDADLSQEKLKGIYDALHSDLEEVKQPIPVGSATYFKKLRAFTLTKSVVMVPGNPARYELIVPSPSVTVTVKDRSARDIYRALDVESVRETALLERKKVGPLTCSEQLAIIAKLYFCVLEGEGASEHSGEKVVSVRGEDARVIHEALRVKEKEERDPVPVFIKRVGTLQCSRSRFLGTESFFCSLTGK